MNKAIKKITALLTLALFTATPVYPMPVSASFSIAGEMPHERVDEVRLPAELGEVEWHAGGPNQPLLIHIQEAHGDTKLQERIGKILAYLKEEYAVDQVFVEGSAFDLERLWMDFLPENPETTHEAARRLLEMGVVSGPEYFLLKNPDAAVRGIEDLEAYRRNSASFYRVLKQKEKTEKFLSGMDAQMDRLASAYLNPQLRDFLRKVRAFEEEKISFEAFLNELIPLIEKTSGLNLDKPEAQLDWPVLVRLKAIRQAEKTLDAAQLKRERRAFLDAAGRFIPKETPGVTGEARTLLEELAMRLDPQSPAVISGSDKHERVFAAAAESLPENFDYTRYPQVIAYAGLLILKSELSAPLVMNEIRSAIEETEDALAETPEEEQAVSLMRDYRAAVRLFHLEWSRADYLEHSAGSFERLSPRRMAAQALALNQGGRVGDVRFEHLNQLERLYREALIFYEGAHRREEAMTLNTMRGMDLSGESAAVVITGGFHAEAFRQFAARYEWNYAQVTPLVRDISGRDAYVSSLIENFWQPAGQDQLKDIPYAATSLAHQTELGRNPVSILAREAEVLARLGVSAQRLLAMPVFAQIAGRLDVKAHEQDRLEVRFLNPDQPLRFLFEQDGTLKEQPGEAERFRWLESQKARSETRAPSGYIAYPDLKAFPAAAYPSIFGAITNQEEKQRILSQWLQREAFSALKNDQKKALISAARDFDLPGVVYDQFEKGLIESQRNETDDEIKRLLENLLQETARRFLGEVADLPRKTLVVIQAAGKGTRLNVPGLSVGEGQWVDKNTVSLGGASQLERQLNILSALGYENVLVVHNARNGREVEKIIEKYRNSLSLRTLRAGAEWSWMDSFQEALKTARSESFERLHLLNGESLVPLEHFGRMRFSNETRLFGFHPYEKGFHHVRLAADGTFLEFNAQPNAGSALLTFSAPVEELEEALQNNGNLEDYIRKAAFKADTSAFVLREQVPDLNVPADLEARLRYHENLVELVGPFPYTQMVHPRRLARAVLIDHGLYYLDSEIVPDAHHDANNRGTVWFTGDSRYVIKAFVGLNDSRYETGRFSDDRYQAEKRFLQSEIPGVETAEMAAFDDAHKIIVMKNVVGQSGYYDLAEHITHLDPAAPEAKTQILDWTERWMTVLARLQSAPDRPAWSGRYEFDQDMQHTEEQIQTLDGLGYDMELWHRGRSVFEDYYREHPSPEVPAQGDYAPLNFIIAGDKDILIDGEFSARWPREKDLATALVRMHQMNMRTAFVQPNPVYEKNFPEIIEHMLSAYQLKSGYTVNRATLYFFMAQDFMQRAYDQIHFKNDDLSPRQYLELSRHYLRTVLRQVRFELSGQGTAETRSLGQVAAYAFGEGLAFRDMIDHLRHGRVQTVIDDYYHNSPNPNYALDALFRLSADREEILRRNALEALKKLGWPLAGPADLARDYRYLGYHALNPPDLRPDRSGPREPCCMDTALRLFKKARSLHGEAGVYHYPPYEEKMNAVIEHLLYLRYLTDNPPLRKIRKAGERSLIIGASGFLGSNVLDVLLKNTSASAKFILIDQREPDLSKVSGEVRSAFESGQFEFRQVDMRDPLEVENLFDEYGGFEQVVNLAAMKSPLWSQEHPAGAIFSNVMSGLYKPAAEYGSRLIQISTAELYLGTADGDVDEETRVDPTRSPYAASKYLAEISPAYLHIPSVSLRMATLYGPGETDALISDMVRDLLHSQKPLQYYGNVVIDFMHVRDAAQGISTVFSKPAVSGTFNLSTGRGIGIYDAADTVRQALEEETGRLISKTRLGALPSEALSRKVLRPDRLRTASGFSAQIAFRQGIQAFVEEEIGKWLSRPAPSESLEGTVFGDYRLGKKLEESSGRLYPLVPSNKTAAGLYASAGPVTLKSRMVPVQGKARRLYALGYWPDANLTVWSETSAPAEDMPSLIQPNVRELTLSHGGQSWFYLGNVPISQRPNIPAADGHWVSQSTGTQISNEELTRNLGAQSSQPVDAGVLPAGSAVKLFEINTRGFMRRNLLNRLDQIDLETLREQGYNTVWLMGAWSESSFSQEMNQRLDRTDEIPGYLRGREASAYAIPDYIINPAFGGDHALRVLREKARVLGMRLMLDFVPGHLARDTHLLEQMPELFILREQAPAPEDEKFYFSHIRGGKQKVWVAHARTQDRPWVDTAQLNFLSPETWFYLRERLEKMTRLADGVRVDSLSEIDLETYRSRWFPEVTPEDFARRMDSIALNVFGKSIDEPNGIFSLLFESAKTESPGFLLIGEVHAGQHARWLEQGLDLVTAHYVFNWLVQQADGGWQNFKDYVLRRGPHSGVTLEYVRKTVLMLEDHDARGRLLKYLTQQQEKDFPDELVTNQAQLLFAALVLQPSVPLVYEGQNKAAFAAMDSANVLPEESDRPFNDKARLQMEAFYRQAMAWRDLPVIQQGSMPFEIPVTGETGPEVLAFARRLFSEAVVAVFNPTPQTRQLTLDLSSLGLEPREVTLEPYGYSVQFVNARSEVRQKLEAYRLRSETQGRSIGRSEVRAKLYDPFPEMQSPDQIGAYYREQQEKLMLGELTSAEFKINALSIGMKFGYDIVIRELEFLKRTLAPETLRGNPVSQEQVQNRFKVLADTSYETSKRRNRINERIVRTLKDGNEGKLENLLDELRALAASNEAESRSRLNAMLTGDGYDVLTLLYLMYYNQTPPDWVQNYVDEQYFQGFLTEGDFRLAAHARSEWVYLRPFLDEIYQVETAGPARKKTLMRLQRPVHQARLSELISNFGTFFLTSPLFQQAGPYFYDVWSGSVVTRFKEWLETWQASPEMWLDEQSPVRQQWEQLSREFWILPEPVLLQIPADTLQLARAFLDEKSLRRSLEDGADPQTAKSEVRAKKDSRDMRRIFDTFGMDEVGKLPSLEDLTAEPVSKTKIKVRVVAPSWGAQGPAVQASEHPSLNRKSMDPALRSDLLERIRQKGAALSDETVRGVFEDLVRRLEKTGIDVVDEQRWQTGKNETSYYAAEAAPQGLVIGRGALVEPDFAGEILLRLALEKTAQESGIQQETISRMAGAVTAAYGPVEGFDRALKEWISLENPRFLNDAFERFRFFDPGQPYESSYLLLKDWMDYAANQADKEEPAYFPVLEQAGFLMRKLWPVMQSDVRPDEVVRDQYFRVIYPFLVFVILRYETFFSLRLLYKEIEEEVSSLYEGFVRSAMPWVQENSALARRDQLINLINIPDHGYPQWLYLTALSLQLKHKKRTSKTEILMTRQDSDTAVISEAKQEIRAKVFSDFKDAVNSHVISQGQILQTALPETLTPASVERFMSQEIDLTRLAISHEAWLSLAVEEYLPALGEDADSQMLKMEGYVDGDNQFSSENVNRIFESFHFISDGKRFELADTLMQAPMWAGIAPIYREEKISLDPGGKRQMILLAGGAGPTLSRIAPMRTVHYSLDSASGTLVSMVYQNSIVSDLIDWMTGRRDDVARQNQRVLRTGARMAPFVHAGMYLYANSKIEDGFFSPNRADLVRWSDAILDVRSAAETSYWQTLQSFDAVDFSEEAEARLGELELYALFRNPESPIVKLASQLELVPGSKRLTDESGRALVNTLFGLYWSGQPRNQRVGTTFLILLHELLEKRIHIHPDGFTVPEIEELRSFLTQETAETPVFERSVYDFEEWKESTQLKDLLALYGDKDPQDYFNFERRYFAAPEVEEGEKQSRFVQMRVRYQPSYFDAEVLPLDHFLQPEKWPLWPFFRHDRLVEWVGTYTKEGLILPGSESAIRFDDSSGIRPGDLVLVTITAKQGHLPSEIQLTFSKLPASYRRSEMRISKTYDDLLRYFAYGDEAVFRAEAQANSQPLVDADIQHLLNEITRRIDFKVWDELHPQAKAPVLNVLKHFEGTDDYSFDGWLRFDEGYDRIYLAMMAEKDRIYIDRRLIEDKSPEGIRLGAFLLFLAAVESNRKNDKTWDADDRRDMADLFEVMFPDWAEIDLLFDRYLAGLESVGGISFSNFQSNRGMAGKGWQITPIFSRQTIQTLEAAGPAESEGEEGGRRIPAIREEGFYRINGGQNGLFMVTLNNAPLSMDIPALSRQPLLLHAIAGLEELDLYDAEENLIGTVSRSAAAAGFESSSVQVRILPKLPAPVSHLIPETSQNYQNLRALALRLEGLMQNTGRTYNRLDFLTPGLFLEADNRVQLDLIRGRILLDPSLIEDPELAAALVQKTLQEQDPVMQLEKRLKLLSEADFFDDEPLPAALPREEESLLSHWPPEILRRYEAFYQRMQDQYASLRVMRTVSNHFRVHRKRYDISEEKFRGWLSEAMRNRSKDFFFASQANGSAWKAEGLSALAWDGKAPGTYLPRAGVGISTPAFFTTNKGRFQLADNKRNPDPTRYLFIRYMEDNPAGKLPEEKKFSFVDLFDLGTGKIVENRQIEHERLEAELEKAIQDVIDLAVRDKTKLALNRLNASFREFADKLVFSETYQQKFQARASVESLEEHLLKVKTEIFQTLNQFLHLTLDSSEYPPETNYAVLDLILNEIASAGADDAEKRAETLRDAYRKNPDRLLFDLNFHLLEEEWSELSPEDNPDFGVNLNDFSRRVMQPIAAGLIHTPDGLSGDDFMSLMFQTLESGLAQIREQFETFMTGRTEEELSRGIWPLQHVFMAGYAPIDYPGKTGEGISSPEHYLIEKIFKEEERKRREISDTDAAERAAYHTAYGAAEGIGASSALIEYKDTSVIVDAGIMIDEKNTPPRWPAFGKLPQAVFITHAHLDHIGAAVTLWRDYLHKKVPVYASEGTIQLLPHVLRGMRGPAAPGDEEIAAFMEQVHPLKTGKWYAVSPEMKIYSHGPAGHLHGAAAFIVSTPDSTTFISGDLSYRAQGPVPGWKDIPENIRAQIDRAVIESTYGKGRRLDESAEEQKLIRQTAARLRHGGKVLFPAFANGRSQRILMLLLQNLQELSVAGELKIYMDGQAAAFTRLYLEAYPEVFAPYQTWIRRNLVLISNQYREGERQRDEARLRNEKEPTIIISSAGNASQGRSHQWAGFLANHAQSAIYFSGYMDPEEAGSVLLEYGKVNRGRPQHERRKFAFEGVGLQTVNAQIDEFKLSGHIGGDDMMAILESIGPSLREVIIQHGGTRQREEVFQWIREHYPEWNPRLIKTGERYQGVLPQTHAALGERRAFFDSLEAEYLPGIPEPVISPQPADTVTEPVEKGEASVPQPAVIEPAEPENLMTVQTVESEAETADLSAQALIEEYQAVVFNQLTASGTLFNAAAKLSPNAALALALMLKLVEPVSESETLVFLAAVRPESESLPVETLEHPDSGKRFNVTQKAAEKLLSYLAAQNKIRRSEVRAPMDMPPENPRRDRRIIEIVRKIGQTPWDEITPAGQRRLVKRLNQVLSKDGSPFDSTTIYSAFVSDEEKKAIEEDPLGGLRGDVSLHNGIPVFSLRSPQDSPETVSGLYHFFDRMGMQGRPGNNRKPLHDSVLSAMIWGTLHTDPRVRYAAVRAIALLPREQQKRTVRLFEMRAQNPETEERILFEILKMFESQQNVEVLDLVLRNPDHSRQVLRQAVMALGQLTSGASAENTRGLAGQALLRTIFDFKTDKQIMLAAIQALGENEKPDTVPLILAALIGQDDPEIVRAAERAFHHAARRIDATLGIPSRLGKRSEVRRESADTRRVFAEAILPLDWPQWRQRSEILRQQESLTARRAFSGALQQHPALHAAAQSIAAKETPRQLIDIRTRLPDYKEIAPVLALLLRSETLHYVLMLPAADESSLSVWRGGLEKYLQTRESLELWGEMTAGEFEERFRILNAGEAGAVELKQHAVSEILNAKKEGRISAIIAENESMSESFASEARRYRFLNLYTPDGLPRTAVLWMGAMLLDELTEDMLSRFDSRRFLMEQRWQGLWAEMQQILAVQVSA